jgi:hypothetical protein
MNTAQLLPHLMKLGEHLKSAHEHYATLKSTGKPFSAEIIAAFVQTKMAPWDPKVGGRSLLDDDTRAAAARFIGGIVVNAAM